MSDIKDKERYEVLLQSSSINNFSDLKINERKLIARNGTDADRAALVKDECWAVRAEVAKFGNDKLRDILVSDEICLVREAVAQYGNNNHRDKLIHDVSNSVRKSIAQYGTDTHRDQLVNDKDTDVRAAVAKFGNVKHQDILVMDKEPVVRCAVAEFGTHFHRNVLMFDRNTDVLIFVAEHGNLRHLSYLIHHKYNEVRTFARDCALSMSLSLEKLENIYQKLAFEKNIHEWKMESSKIKSGNKYLLMWNKTITDLSTGKSGKLSIPPGIDLKSSNRTEVEKLLQGKDAVLKHTNGQDIKCQLNINPKGYSINLCKEGFSNTSSGMEL